jgi:hypothetical protein
MECEWRGVCRFPDGSTETTIWMTQDGAEEMASETEQEAKKPPACRVRSFAGRQLKD